MDLMYNDEGLRKIQKIVHSMNPKFHDSEEFPKELYGAKILDFGLLNESSLPNSVYIEGGLVIDFVPEGEKDTKRVIFGFNDLGIWIEYLGIKA